MHVVCMNISAADEKIYKMLYSFASEDRQKRADACRNSADALRCVAAGALLRYAMNSAGLCHIPSVTAETPSGKPYVEGAGAFCFNLSHSGDWVVLAWGQRSVGVDVQFKDPGRAVQDLIRRYCPECGEPNTFYEYWTAKESWLKYLGIGLTRRLDSFKVDPQRGLVSDPQAKTNAAILSYPQIHKDYTCCVCSEEAVTEVQILSAAQLLEKL